MLHTADTDRGTMKVIKLATIAAAMVAATIVLPATAQADDDYQQFASPSGNIRCLLIGENNPAPIAMCQISDYTYVAPPGAIKARDGTPCEQRSPSRITCRSRWGPGGETPWGTRFCVDIARTTLATGSAVGDRCDSSAPRRTLWICCPPPCR
jgi:hypothetical protein